MEFFLKLTSPKVVSQTLLSEPEHAFLTAQVIIYTYTYFDRRTVTVCCIVSSLWHIYNKWSAVLPALPAVSCTILQGRKRSTWDIFQSVIIILSQPAWLAHHLPLRPCPDLETQAPANLYFRLRPIMIISCRGIADNQPVIITIPQFHSNHRISSSLSCRWKDLQGDIFVDSHRLVRTLPGMLWVSCP